MGPFEINTNMIIWNIDRLTINLGHWSVYFRQGATEQEGCAKYWVGGGEGEGEGGRGVGGAPFGGTRLLGCVELLALGRGFTLW